MRDAKHEDNEQSKTFARMRATQDQLTEKVERIDEVDARIVTHFDAQRRGTYHLNINPQGRPSQGLRRCVIIGSLQSLPERTKML